MKRCGFLDEDRVSLLFQPSCDPSQRQDSGNRICKVNSVRQDLLKGLPLKPNMLQENENEKQQQQQQQRDRLWLGELAVAVPYVMRSRSQSRLRESVIFMYYPHEHDSEQGAISEASQTSDRRLRSGL